MSLSRRNPKRDANEPAIRQALEAQGFVVDTISGKGLPDLLVSKAGRSWLVEIKQPKAPFTPAQIAWRQRWQGPASITLRSLEDCQRFCLLACENEQLSLNE